ncbi:hypothetical protein ACLB2K_018903 [Fragaria x ananassa]
MAQCGGCNNNDKSNGGGDCDSHKSTNKGGNTKTGGKNKNNDGGGDKKSEELQPHPLKEQLPGVQYCVNSPPPWIEAIVLGFQHYLLTLGITVLIPNIIVPQMGGSDVEKAKVVQTMLFLSGLNTLLQSLFGTRLPSVVVGSYAYVLPTTSIILANRYKAFTDPHERFLQSMRGIQGALIVTASFQMIVGFLGLWRNVVRFLSPLSIVPYITFAGLGLYHLGFPMVARCVELGLPELIIVYLSRFINTKWQIFDRFAVMFSVAIVWIYIPYPFQWGSPTFNAGEAFAMVAASLVSLIESSGTFYATARYGSATPVPPSVVSRSVGWLGVGVFLNGMFGSLTGTTASVENAGLLALTRVASRRVIQISAGFMIFFSIFVPQYFREYRLGHNHCGPRWFNDVVIVTFMSHTLVAALVALILDCSLSREYDATRKDSGLNWWAKFGVYGSDVRNDEFYALPCSLDKLFPAH